METPRGSEDAVAPLGSRDGTVPVAFVVEGELDAHPSLRTQHGLPIDTERAGLASGDVHHVPAVDLQRVSVPAQSPAKSLAAASSTICMGPRCRAASG